MITQDKNFNQYSHAPRLAMVTCVQDESALIWANLHYHHSIGVSKVYVYLDRCTDGTLDIVKSIPWAEPIVVDPEIAKMSRSIGMLQQCLMDNSLERARRDGFDWLLMIDPDEFAFADNTPETDAGEHSSVLSRADLTLMLADVPADISMVSLRTVESVPCAMDESAPFWMQQYFQDGRALERDIFYPRTGEYHRWDAFLAHKQGKSIVRTTADVQSYGPHYWVAKQEIMFPQRPDEIRVPALKRGFHFHIWAYNRRHFREKFRKLSWIPNIRDADMQVALPIQCFKELCFSMSEADLYDYLSKHFFLTEERLDRYVLEGLITKDDTIEQILKASGFAPLSAGASERRVQHLSLSEVYTSSDGDQTPRILPKEHELLQTGEARLALVMCVRDESDLIAANLRYHHSLGVSKAYVYLDRCADDTLEIVKALPWAEPIVISEELSKTCASIGSLQRCCMDDCLERARKDGFEWLLTIDPDEFAFGDNAPAVDADERAYLLDRANLSRMLSDVPDNVCMVRLKTVESVPCAIADDAPFWKQRYFQKDRAVKREIFDPRTGERYEWGRFLGHSEGKSIVRTAADVQAYNSHEWVKNQQLPFPRRPAKIGLTTAEKGYHFHFWTYNRRHFREKFRKLAAMPNFWPCGIRRELPKQRFKELSISMSEGDLYEYVSSHVFLPEQQLERYVADGLLIADHTVDHILKASTSGVQIATTPERTVPRLEFADVCLPDECNPPLLSMAERVYEARDFRETCLKGVYAAEIVSGRYMRWTAPEAEIDLRISSGGCTLVIDMYGLGHLFDRNTTFEINNRTIPSNDVRVTESTVCLALPEEVMAHGERQTLGIYAPVLDTSCWNGRDTRALGMPVFAILRDPLKVARFSPAQLSHGISSWSDAWLTGFHLEELYEGSSFRWTKPDAYVNLQCEPGDYLLALNLGSLHHMVQADPIEVRFNGHRLEPNRAIASGKGQIAFSLARAHFSDSVLQSLHIRTAALHTSSWSTEDRRQLGIPLFGLELRPLNQGYIATSVHAPTASPQFIGKE